MTTKKKKYRQVTREQAETFYQLGIPFQLRSWAAKGKTWENYYRLPYPEHISGIDRMFVESRSGHKLSVDNFVAIQDLIPSRKAFSIQWKYSAPYKEAYVTLPVLFNNSFSHHEEIEKLLGINIQYRVEVDR